MKYPSLKVWLIATTLLSGLLFLIHQSKDDISSFFFKKPIELAFKKAMPKHKEVRVVILCSSHGKNGISDPEILRQIILEKSGEYFDFIKVCKGQAELEDFTENPYLIEKIKTYNPDYLIIQESQLFFERKNSRGSIKNLGLNEIKMTTYLRGMFLGNERAYRSTMKNPKNGFNSKMDTMPVNNKVRWGRQLKTDCKKWNDFASNFNAWTIAINIPVTRPVEMELDRIRNSKEFKLLVNQNKQSGHFEHIQFKQKFPFRYFSDKWHLNDEGEEIYTEWLMNELLTLHNSLSDIR